MGLGYQVDCHERVNSPNAILAGLGGVGGFAELTTVSRDGVTQRIIDRWPGDEIGGPLHPVPNDWTAWRRLNPAPR
ncbi:MULTISPECIES: hypothetical protein [Bradyrhizobium]|jgi:hypothetical protein|uniref:Uncharacterized protein n=1 Tax=Bradyrhizobium elkanii TaxID=29448 RepID=A0A8I1Y1L5_BRAEL|nr:MULTISPECIES: hypothetical protein [Bradyrhizobium]MBP1290384.1 hypothetical protein [Bradyrhizobium elkanii]MCP1972150.1 hypothetical protein [Bradyrhizobium elkanii]MCS3452413.1 hypothetical protein [Bradyrhizobium elkanii]MCS3565484.1 hypothetical protein [Bradyrhizobium elkanii]MCS4106340.1 hypothetical protein [Bradyrhizobium elkanii]